EGRCWYEGSLHLDYRQDEAAVAQEFAEVGPSLGYDCAWLTRDQVLERFKAAKTDNLIGGLWSPVELTVDPRTTIATIPGYLRERFGVDLRFGSAVRSIDLPIVETGAERWIVKRAIICSGEDFETLYPAVYGAPAL